MPSVFKSTDIDDSGRKIVNHSGRVNQAVMWQSAHRVFVSTVFARINVIRCNRNTASVKF